jgi:hypothetical protein
MVPLTRLAPLSIFCLFLFGCDRSRGASADAGASANGPDAAPVDASSTAHEDPPPETPPTWSEARRARLSAAQIANEPGLEKNAAALREHFGGAIPAAIDLQAVPLANGRQILLVEAVADEPKPMALLVDADGASVWTRERPTGGITPPVRALTLTPRPDSGVALFFWDEPTQLLAVRMWNADGAPFADLQIARAPRVDAIAAAWWKGRGWLAVASMPGAARAHLLRENGTPSWGADGVAVGAATKASRPVAIALDTKETWVLVQRAPRPAGERVLAFRYDTGGEPLWKQPTDLGPSKGTDRIDATRARDGVVRIAFDGKTVELRSDGTTL